MLQAETPMFQTDLQFLFDLPGKLGECFFTPLSQASAH
jgi:hypothetical protein